MDPDASRFAPEWASIFELRAPLRRDHPYVNSGLLAFDADRHRNFLERWWELCDAMTECGPLRSPDDPVKFADQDALNALLMSEFADSAKVIERSVPMGLPEVADTEVVDVDHLECRYEGRIVPAMHSLRPPKPWMRPARYRLARSAYLTCLCRVLVGPDLRIVLDERTLPTWLRSGARASATRSVLYTLAKVPKPLFDWAYRTKVSTFGESPAGTSSSTSYVRRPSEDRRASAHHG